MYEASMCDDEACVDLHKGGESTSLRGHSPDTKIDYIFVNRGDFRAVARGRVEGTNGQCNGKLCSDHRMLWGEFSFVSVSTASPPATPGRSTSDLCPELAATVRCFFDANRDTRSTGYVGKHPVTAADLPDCMGKDLTECVRWLWDRAVPATTGRDGRGIVVLVIKPVVAATIVVRDVRVTAVERSSAPAGNLITLTFGSCECQGYINSIDLDVSAPASRITYTCQAAPCDDPNLEYNPTFRTPVRAIPMRVGGVGAAEQVSWNMMITVVVDGAEHDIDLGRIAMTDTGRAFGQQHELQTSIYRR